MANNLMSKILSGPAQQLIAEGTSHGATGVDNPGVAVGKLIVSEIRDALEHLPASVVSYLDMIFGRVGEIVSGTLAAHHQPVEVGIDPRVLTGPTPDKGTTVTTTSWPSFWDQIDHHQPVEVGIDPRILTGPTPDKDTTITMTSWPSFWDQIDRGDHDTYLAVFDGVSLATSGADHDPFNMFPTDHPHWLLS